MNERSRIHRGGTDVYANSYGEAAAGDLAPRSFEGQGSDVQGVVAFSSKALHHYLLMTDKLLAEKDLRIQERDAQLAEKKQHAAELEGYVKILENEIARLKEKPEGWF